MRSKDSSECERLWAQAASLHKSLATMPSTHSTAAHAQAGDRKKYVYDGAMTAAGIVNFIKARLITLRSHSSCLPSATFSQRPSTFRSPSDLVSRIGMSCRALVMMCRRARGLWPVYPLTSCHQQVHGSKMEERCADGETSGGIGRLAWSWRKESLQAAWTWALHCGERVKEFAWQCEVSTNGNSYWSVRTGA